MIIREEEEAFIAIEQHFHASISGYLFNQLKTNFSPKASDSLEYAIINHDCGWIPFDYAPIWNDTKNHPFSFIDYPIALKAVVYKNGIDEVFNTDTYAALLCSEHYSRFMENNASSFAKKFVQYEKARQQDIIASLSNFDNQLFQQHYEILQFFDNVSLYICLNKPGVSKQDEHPFFQKGISLPSTFGMEQLHLNWDSTKKIVTSKAIFKTETPFKLVQKRIPKATIAAKGLQQAYDDTPYTEQWITVHHR